MAQLSGAIARYHNLFEHHRYRDLAWAEELQETMRQQHLTHSGRLIAPVLRPQFITLRKFETLTRVAERFASILDQIEAVALRSPPLLDRLRMLPAEKMLAVLPSGYSRFCVTSRMDVQLQNGSLSVRGYETCKPRALGFSEPLADLFLTLPIVKEFKRSRYKLSKIGGRKFLAAAILQTWKDFGGFGRPNIAIVEFGDESASDSTEGHFLAELFNRAGFSARVISPDQLEYKNRRLRARDFEIDVVFRRLLTRELLIHFDLSHPLLLAYRDRAVCVVNNFRSEIAHRRSLFDLVTDENVTADLPFSDRRLIRTFVPWTRVVSQKKTRYREQDVDLPEFVRRTRERFVLRPNEDAGDEQIFVGAEMSPSAWDRALNLALKTAYVVQERFAFGRDLFPVFQSGELQMKEAETSVHPHIFNGKVQGASAALQITCGGCASPLGIVPVFLLSEN